MLTDERTGRLIAGIARTHCEHDALWQMDSGLNTHQAYARYAEHVRCATYVRTDDQNVPAFKAAADVRDALWLDMA